MVEEQKHWDSSYQRQYNGGNYLYKGIFQDQILWQDLSVKLKSNQFWRNLYKSYELENLLVSDNQI